MLLLPSARFKTKLRHPPAEGQFLKAGLVGLGQIDLRLAAYNDITAACLVQITDQLSRKKSRIGQQTNPRTGHLRGHLLQAALHQSASPGVGSRIPGTQRSVPKLLAVSFKAQEGMIGGTPFLFGVVADSGPLLFSIEGQDHRVQVKNQARARIGKGEELASDLIM